MQRKELGIAVIGSGRIGTLRATLAAHPFAHDYLAVADRDRTRASSRKNRGQFHSGNNLEVMSRPEVNAVVVSTIEVEHTLPILQALELGSRCWLKTARVRFRRSRPHHRGSPIRSRASRRLQPPFQKRYLAGNRSSTAARPHHSGAARPTALALAGHADVKAPARPTPALFRVSFITSI